MSAVAAKPPSPPDTPDNVVALSRYRAQLGRGRRARRIDELLDAPDPRRAVRALPGDELYYLVHEAGLSDALDILPHASADQVQTCLDFAVWDRDQLSMDSAGPWLAALAEAPFDTVADWIRGMDIELVALIIRKRARIYDLTQEEPPDEPEGPLFNAPDGFFTLELLGDPDEVRVTQQLLDAIYRNDVNFARRVLVGTRAEMDSDLEELAYRWRSGRMADLGFVDFYEALEVYRELDPASVKLGSEMAPRLRPRDAEGQSHLRVPSALAERLAAGRSPFARAVAGVTAPDELADLHFALVSLSNRVLSADRVTPGDDKAVLDVLTRMAATLDIAVEFLARGVEERAIEAVRTVPLVPLFRLGASLVGKVRRLGLALLRDTPFSKLRPRIEVFEPHEAEVIAAVTRTRPMFPGRLDDPPTGSERPFASLADIAVATAALERAGAALALLTSLGVDPVQLTDQALAGAVPEAAAIDAAVLARTAVVGRLLGATSFRPLTAAELRDLEARLPPAERRERALAVLASAAGGPLSPATGAVAARWAASVAPLEPVLVRPR